MLTIPISVILLDYALINITVEVVFTYTLSRLIFYDSCFNRAATEEQGSIPLRECLNVGTVPTYKMHNMGQSLRLKCTT